MKKLIVGSMIAAGALCMGAQMVSAQDGYAEPPGEPGDGSVSPLPPTIGGSGGGSGTPVPSGPSAGTPGPAATLPSTGAEVQMMMQIGLVTFAAGGALVGASAFRRRRLGA